MENTVIEQDVEKALTLKEQATALKVVDNATRIQAATLGKMAKDLAAQITERHDKLIKMAHAAHKEAIRVMNIDLEPVNEVIKICRDEINIYDREQARLQAIEQARLQKIADEAAEKERQALLAKAVKAEEAGKTDKAEALLEKAEEVYTAPVTVAPTVAKTVQTEAGNITQAKETIVTVTDTKAFLTALLQKNFAPTMVEIKQGPLKAWVKANGLESFPGLNIQKTTSIRF